MLSVPLQQKLIWNESLVLLSKWRDRAVESREESRLETGLGWSELTQPTWIQAERKKELDFLLQLTCPAHTDIFTEYLCWNLKHQPPAAVPIRFFTWEYSLFIQLTVQFCSSSQLSSGNSGSGREGRDGSAGKHWEERSSLHFIHLSGYTFLSILYIYFISWLHLTSTCLYNKARQNYLCLFKTIISREKL